MAAIGSQYSPAIGLQANALRPGPTADVPKPESSGMGEPHDGVTLTPLGNRIAQSTVEAASQNRNLRKKACFHYVKEGLSAEGIDLHGKYAYQAAPQLARSPHFKETKVSRDELTDLPAGAVVVWNRNPKANHPAGHISVAMGDGREVSDRIRPQTTTYRSQYRVFLPVDPQPTMMAGEAQPAPVRVNEVI